MRDAGLSFAVLALLFGRKGQSGYDFVEELDAMPKHFEAEEAAATIVPTSGLAG